MVVSSNPRVAAEMRADAPLDKSRCGLPKMLQPRRAFRLSLLREALREIRNVSRRIWLIRDKKLDCGLQIDPCVALGLPPETQEKALACCMRDMRNLMSSRPPTTMVDAELWLQGWYRGAKSALHNWHTE